MTTLKAEANKLTNLNYYMLLYLSMLPPPNAEPKLNIEPLTCSLAYQLSNLLTNITKLSLIDL